MTLAVFFTYGVSLQTWIDTGLFDREKTLYEEHLERGSFQKIIWLTYGIEDARLADRLHREQRLHPKIIVCPRPAWLPGTLGKLVYSLCLPLLYHRKLREANLLKTNQMKGSWSAVLAKWFHRKPLIVRTGFTLSLFAKRQVRSPLKKTIYRLMERFAYRFANLGCVASHQDKRYLCSTYRIPETRLHVLPNYINTRDFFPEASPNIQERFIFVGRLTPQKNLVNLIEAIAQTRCALDMYGAGPLQPELEARVAELHAAVSVKGVVPNKELPHILRQYRYYILPSFYEGMPKTLLEAMACGLVCIGTDVAGIQEVIDDGVNGILAPGTHVSSLVEAIHRALHTNVSALGNNAVRAISLNFSLESVVTQEATLFRTVTNEHLLSTHA